MLAFGAPTLVAFAPGDSRAADLGFDEFLRTAGEDLARRLPAQTVADQDAYVLAAAARLRRLTSPPAVQWNDQYKLDIKPVGQTKIFSVTMLRAKPNMVQPPHNHPQYSVATMGLTGEVRVRNFEPVGELPPYSSKALFQLRQTREQQLRAGDISTLSPHHDNFHTFEAGPGGATWIDVSTPHATEGAGDFSYLRLTDPAPAHSGDLLEGRWGLKD
jgi:hypothetical protein